MFQSEGHAWQESSFEFTAPNAGNRAGAEIAEAYAGLPAAAPGVPMIVFFSGVPER